MNVNTIKLLAIVTMVIDHVGLFFFPHVEIARLIGRIAFPLFAWLIANGAYHTHDIYRYFRRLLVLACISQIPFTLANQLIGAPAFYLNVVFTLSLGLFGIILIRKNIHPLFTSILILLLGLLANLLNTDYGAFGVFAVVLFYVFYERAFGTLISQLLLFSIPYILFVTNLTTTILSQFVRIAPSEIYGLLALVPIFFYSNKERPRGGRFFYLFYPLQYVCIYLGLRILS
ncbi:MAG: hypothetical protein RIQ41_537 [Candidatus Parcubacteria bacterium]|jgi:hypothetical protein